MPETGIHLIRVKTATRERLNTVGHMKETYDGVINRLIDEYEKNTRK
jgi:hypothetical protein